MINHDSWTLDAIVEVYKHDQRRTRGLREPTLKSYEAVVRPFLRFSLGEDPLEPARLMPPMWCSSSPHCRIDTRLVR